MSLVRRAAQALPPWTAPLLRRLYCAMHGLGDARYVARTGQSHLPPASLRYHVGSIRAADYTRVGQRCAEHLERALGVVGRSLRSFENALDFGCGTGRTLEWLRDRGPSLTGTDLHPGCVAWAQERFGFVKFRINRAEPPLDFPDATFDLVFSFSVFTHLDEACQRAWIAELRRISRPGGVLLLSTHGPSCTAGLSPADREVLDSRGFLALPARGLWGVFERYYNSYHLEPWVRDVWGKALEVRAYLPRGLNDHQDLYVLERVP